MNPRHRWTLIPSLFASCGPTTIARLIVPVIVDSIQGQANRPWSYIGQKCLERMSPTITHQNSSAAVVLIGQNIRIKTTPQHGRPDTVLRCFQSFASTAMFCQGRHDAIAPVATTTGRLTVPQLTALNSHVTPAFATAEPHRSRHPICGSCENLQPAAPSSKHVNNRRWQHVQHVTTQYRFSSTAPVKRAFLEASLTVDAGLS